MWLYIFAPASGGILAGVFQLYLGMMHANFEALKPKEEIKEIEPTNMTTLIK